MADVQPLSDYLLGPFLIADLSTDSESQKIPIPMKGQIVGMALCQAAATTVAEGDLTVRKNGTAMTGITMVVPIGAIGAVTTKEFSPNIVTGDVDEGDEVDINTNGDTTTAGVGTVMLRIRR